MEGRVIALAQQQQQIQARDLTPVLARAVIWRGVVVEGLQLGPVAHEGGGVFEVDGDQGAGLEDGARGLQG